MMAHGNTIVVYSTKNFEALLVLPNSLSGWFDPAAQYGVVKFSTVAQANETWRKMS